MQLDVTNYYIILSINKMSIYGSYSQLWVQADTQLFVHEVAAMLLGCTKKHCMCSNSISIVGKEGKSSRKLWYKNK